MTINKDEMILRKRLAELAETAYQQNHYTYTAFLDLYEQSIYQEMHLSFSYMSNSLNGGHPYADRQIVCFGSKEELGYEEELPISCITVVPESIKFAEALTHRDFLGAVMNLGIERSMIGDILISDKTGYIFCLKHIAPVISEQLCRVKHTQVMCKTAIEYPHIEPEYQEVTGFVTSCRLDAVIGLAFQLSRSQSIPYIQGKCVFMDGKLTISNSIQVKEGMVISVRGLGKFIFDGIEGISKKERFRVKIRRFI